MTADFRKVRPGEPLRITAKAWNRVLDSVSTRPEFLAGEGAYSRLNHVVQIKNTGSSAVAKWGVLAIAGVLNSPTAGAASLAQWQDSPLLQGDVQANPASAAFVVAVEPIAAGKVGRAAVSGVVQLKVADLGKAPGAQVLWKNSEWALVRLHAGIVRGTFTAPWTKGATATVTDAVSTTVTYTATNYIASLLPSGTMPCLIAYVSGEWVLLAWDWTGLSGYSGSAQQVLAHNASGQLVWLSTTACT